MRVAALGDIHGNLPALQAVQYDRLLPGGLRIVDPGGVGLPYEGQPGAFWALLGPDVELRCTEYDVAGTVEAIHALRAPVGEELLELMLYPPDPETATARFERLRGA